MRWVAVVAVVSGLALASGCSLFRRAPEPLEPRPGAVQEGVASWYGPGFHGRQTASGEVYDQHDLTAAHRTLPHGTQVLITNLRNHRSVEVRINDRGPYVDGRIIDLSYAAARSVGMIGPGTAPVRVEVLSPATRQERRRAPAFEAEESAAVVASARGAAPPPSAPRRTTMRYTVQVASFTTAPDATRLHRRLRERFPRVHVETLAAREVHYRVRIGPFGSRGDAARTAAAVASLGLPVIIMEENVVIAQ